MLRAELLFAVEVPTNVRLNIVGIIGASALRERNLVEDIILSLRFDGWAVSTLKWAPDGFDIDQPGKVSHRRREAGCHEVMLVGRLGLAGRARS